MGRNKWFLQNIYSRFCSFEYNYCLVNKKMQKLLFKNNFEIMIRRKHLQIIVYLRLCTPNTYVPGMSIAKRMTNS